jgi:hypothetical protein
MEEVRKMFEVCPHIRDKIEGNIKDERDRDYFNYLFNREKLGEEKEYYLRCMEGVRRLSSWMEWEKAIMSKPVEKRTNYRTIAEHRYIVERSKDAKNGERWTVLMRIHSSKLNESCRECQEEMHSTVDLIHGENSRYFGHLPNNLCRKCNRRRWRRKRIYQEYGGRNSTNN